LNILLLFGIAIGFGLFHSFSTTASRKVSNCQVTLAVRSKGVFMQGKLNRTELYQNAIDFEAVATFIDPNWSI